MSDATSDVVDLLVGIAPGSQLDMIRRTRAAARENAQASYLALLAPHDPGEVTAVERFATAAFVTGLHGPSNVADFYMERLADDGIAESVRAEIAVGSTHGPYGDFSAGPLTGENVKGPAYQVAQGSRQALGPKLSAAFEHAHMLVFHPRDSNADRLQTLLDRGWSTTAVVTLSQLVAFLSFQIRMIAGLRALATSLKQTAAPAMSAAAGISDMTETTLTPPAHEHPVAFTQAQLGWLPWLEPLPLDQLTDRHWAGLVDESRSKSPYFMLLARDPDILGARTKTDKDIFYNPTAGLPRAERELSAAATSRYNGCIYCASVHARFASQFSKRTEDVQKLLDDGVAVDVGERWNAIVAASVALAATPIAFGQEHVGRLHAVGLDDAAIADMIASAAFFNWANRLMLSLGEPEGGA